MFENRRDVAPRNLAGAGKGVQRRNRDLVDQMAEKRRLGEDLDVHERPV
jgi:hypothetical protein